MIYAPGVTSKSVDVQIVDDAGLPVTGLVAATFPTLSYSVAGANADVAFPALSDLAALTTAWSAGGVKERGGGVYRLDCPDALFSVAGKVKIRGEATGKHVIVPLIDVSYPQVDARQWLGGTIPAVNVTGVPKVDLIDWLGLPPNALSTGRVDASAGALAANVIVAGSIAAAALNGKGDWLLATGYSAPPTVAQIATALFQDLLAGADFATAGSFGKLVKDNLDAQVSLIKAKTDALTFDVAGVLSVNVRRVNSIIVNGAGTTLSPWGP